MPRTDPDRLIADAIRSALARADAARAAAAAALDEIGRLELMLRGRASARARARAAAAVAVAGAAVTRAGSTSGAIIDLARALEPVNSSRAK